MTLFERTNQFNEKNMSLCEKGCTYIRFYNDTKKVECDCNIKNDMNYYSEETNKGDLINKLDSSKSSSNLKVAKCINNVFKSPKQSFSNSGFISLLIVLIIFIIVFILFCIKGRKLLINKIDETIYKKFVNKKKSNSKTKEQNNNNNHNNQRELNKIKNKNKIQKKEQKKTQQTKGRKNPKNKRIKYNNSTNLDLINNHPNKKIIQETLVDNNNKSNTKLDDKPDKENNYEMNTLSYEQAIEYDKRSCCEYYMSLLKNKQLFLFTFCSFNDYNSGIIKKFILFLSFAIHYTVSALFFNDDMMHQIYQDEGKYNISYQFPKILITALSSIVILRIMLECLILTDRNVLKVKHQILKSQAEQMKKKVLKCINIKFLIFFVFNFFLLILFWFYLTCFNDTYENTQVYLIENTFFAFAISLFYPFIWNIFPSVLRISALDTKEPDKECLYSFSKILQIV